MSVPLPAHLGKYQLLSHIAEGGMADVYLGRLVGPGGFEKRLVVKVIRPELAQRREFCEMFVAEAKITVALTHANIVPVYELGVVDGQYFLAMELVDGPTVHTLVFEPQRGGPLPPPLGAYVVEQVLRALDYAHRNGVVHRDLSSANVMCSRDGEVKVVDFGIASHFNARQTVRLQGGSVGYMAPEQGRGEEPDARSDLYAVGVLLAEMLTARRFAQLPRGEALTAPPYHVPPPLAEIIETATRQDKDARYADAAAMLVPLSRYLRTEEPLTQADLSRLVRRRAPDERRLSRGTPARLLAMITQTDAPLSLGPLTLPSKGGPRTRPIERGGGAGTEDGVEPVGGAAGPPAPRGAGDGDPTPALPRRAPPRGTGEIAPVRTGDGGAEGRGAADPAASAAPDEAVEIAVPPPGGTVIFASRPARTHATWRTYAGAAVALALLAGGAVGLRSRWLQSRELLPPPAAALGILRVEAPAGAALRVDGKEQPVGAALQLPPGPHEVLAEAPGRRPQRISVEVRAGETLRERLRMPWVVGHLRVESEPPAAVALNGEAVGTTPLSLDVPLDRAASLRLSQKGYLPLLREVLPSQWVAASPGARLAGPAGAAGDEADGRQPEMTLKLLLEPLGKGLLTVGATPWAQVFVDGEARGDTPIRRLQLPAGAHTLRLYCAPPGCPQPRELRQNITVEPGRELRRVADFRQSPPTLKE